MGRLFDYKILDMVEFGIENFVAMHQIKGLKAPWGIKPLFVFQGDKFENDKTYKVIKNLLIDFFNQKQEEEIDKNGFDLIIVCSCIDDKILFRTYCCTLESGLSKYPKATLIPQGPNFDMKIRRTQLAEDDIKKQAYKVPKEKLIKKVKNISHNTFGDKIGTIHMEKQDFDRLQTRKMKGLKRKRDETDLPEDREDVEEGEE